MMIVPPISPQARIQRRDGFSVRNKLPFGRRLQRAARSKALFSPWAKVMDCGFQDGGCHIFAAALKKWSGDRFSLAGVYGQGAATVQHVVANLGPYYFDSDGMAAAADLLAKMRDIEMLAAPHLGAISAVGNGIPYDQSAVDLLAVLLRECLGAFRINMIYDGLTALG